MGVCILGKGRHMRRSGSERLVWSRGQLSRAPWTLMTQRQVWFSIRITESSFGGVTRSDSCLARELCLQWRGESWAGSEGAREDIGTVTQARQDGDLTQGGAGRQREQEEESDVAGAVQ